MKPFGTITMCFPHVSEDTRRTLESIMKEAENFADFAERLCNKVCSESTSQMVRYFAVYFSFRLNDYKLVDKLEKAGKVPVLAEPLLLVTRYRRGAGIDWDTMLQSLSRALEEAPNDWITYHLYLTWRFYAEFNFPESDIDVRLVDAIREDVSKNKEFEIFKAYLLILESTRHMYDLDLVAEVEVAKQALNIAEKWDDQVTVAHSLCTIAGTVKFIDEDQALELLNSSRKLSEDLGYRSNIGKIEGEMAHLAGQQGKLDAAIEHLYDFQRIRESLGLPITILRHFLAIYHNLKGDGDEALELIDACARSFESVRKQSAVLLALRAWALVNLGRYIEAREEIDVAKELALKSGVVWYRDFWTPMIEGILEKAERRFDVAIDLLGDALESVAEYPIPLFQNICYVNLVEIEIEQLDTESLDRPVDSSGHWMQLFDEHLTHINSPGFVAYFSILKAKLHRKQSDYDKVRAILKEVVKVAESLGMRYLNSVAASMFPEMEIYTE